MIHPARIHLTPIAGLPLRLFAMVAGVVVALAIARLPLALTAAALVGLVILLVVIRFPLLGLALALWLGPWGALENIVFGNALFDTGQIALFVTFAAWAGAALGRRRVTIPSTILNGPLILFLLIVGLSLVDAYAIQPGLVEAIKWLEILLLVWLIVDVAGQQSAAATGKPAIRFILGALFLAGLTQALIGIWQFGLRDNGPEHFLILGQFYRAYGTFEQPNPFGGYMNLTALLAAGTTLGFLLHRWTGRRESPLPWMRADWLWLGFAGVTAAAASLALIFSWSRGAWLGFLAGGVVLLMFSAQRLRLGLSIMLLTGSLATGLLLVGLSVGYGPAQSIVDRLVGFGEEFTPGDVRGIDINDTNYSVLERLAHWQAAVDMARDDIWTGVGFGNYEVAYSDYALINWPAALGHAHNYYLNVLAEIGVPGLLAYLLFWMVVIGQTIRLARKTAWPIRGIAVGLLAAWVALAVHHLVDKLYVNNIYIHLGAMLGLLQLLDQTRVPTAPLLNPAVRSAFGTYVEEWQG